MKRTSWLLFIACLTALLGCGSKPQPPVHPEAKAEGPTDGVELPQSDFCAPDTNPPPNRIVVSICHEPPSGVQCDKKSCRDKTHWVYKVNGTKYDSGQLVLMLKAEGKRDIDPVVKLSNVPVLLRVDAYAPYAIVEGTTTMVSSLADMFQPKCAATGPPDGVISAFETTGYMEHYDLPVGRLRHAQASVVVRYNAAGGGWRTTVTIDGTLVFDDPKKAQEFLKNQQAELAKAGRPKLCIEVDFDYLAPWQAHVWLVHDLNCIIDVEDNWSGPIDLDVIHDCPKGEQCTHDNCEVPEHWKVQFEEKLYSVNEIEQILKEHFRLRQWSSFFDHFADVVVRDAPKFLRDIVDSACNRLGIECEYIEEEEREILEPPNK